MRQKSQTRQTGAAKAIKVIGWGWMYLSTILDDYSRYIIAWKLCTTMKTSDVTDNSGSCLLGSQA
jgi:putative transposase